MESGLHGARFVRPESKAAERVLMLTTFNGQTAIESVLGADVADDMIAYVDAAVRPKLLSAMPEGAIGLAANDTGLTMTAGDGKSKNDLKVGRDVEIPVIAGTSMNHNRHLSLSSYAAGWGGLVPANLKNRRHRDLLTTQYKQY